MPSTALDACVPAKPSRAFGLHCFLCVVCEARLGPPGCYPCPIHRTHGPFGKRSILLFKPVATVKSFLATVCAQVPPYRGIRAHKEFGRIMTWRSTARVPMPLA